jgi:hypothetical protein
LRWRWDSATPQISAVHFAVGRRSRPARSELNRSACCTPRRLLRGRLGSNAKKLSASKCFPLFRPVADIRGRRVVRLHAKRAELFPFHSQHYANTFSTLGARRIHSASHSADAGLGAGTTSTIRRIWIAPEHYAGKWSPNMGNPLFDRSDRWRRSPS